jgi:hypothetical protein
MPGLRTGRNAAIPATSAVGDRVNEDPREPFP